MYTHIVNLGKLGVVQVQRVLHVGKLSRDTRISMEFRLIHSHVDLRHRGMYPICYYIEWHGVNIGILFSQCSYL